MLQQSIEITAAVGWYIGLSIRAAG